MGPWGERLGPRSLKTQKDSQSALTAAWSIVRVDVTLTIIWILRGLGIDGKIIESHVEKYMMLEIFSQH